LNDPEYCDASSAFEHDLKRLLKVIAPIAKAIKCLESSRSTPADVYLYWMAIVAELEDVFNNRVYFRQGDQDAMDLKESIRAIVNGRLNEMMRGASHDIYYVAFFLEPGTFNLSRC
jgi:hypothetical protein